MWRALLALCLAALIGANVALAEPAILKRGNLAEPDTLDPQKWFTTYESEILRDLYCGLLQLDTALKPIPGGAESWTTSPDGLTWTFKLRADAKWSDGQPVTAEDYRLGFERNFNPKVASPYANFGYAIRNSKAVTAGEKPASELGVRVIDPLTLEITLERPSQTLLWLLAAYPNFAPIPKHLYDQKGEDWLKGGMVTNGPFQLHSWVPNSEIQLVKNPYFFDAKQVALDQVNYYPTDDDNAAVKRFRAGELDLNLRFPPHLYQMLKRDMPAETFATPASWIGYVVMNQTDPRFADARVRRALSLAIDRETLAKRVLATGELPAWSIIPPSTENFKSLGTADFSSMPMAARRAEARKLLAEAGYGPGNKLTFTFMHRIGEANKRVALATAEMWKAVGIDARLEANEVKIHYARLRQQQFEVADGGWSAPPDAEFFVYLARGDSIEMNFGKWSNAEFDRLTDLATREQDLGRRGEYFAQADTVLADETGMIPVYIPVNRDLVHQWVKGFHPNAVDYHPSRWLSIQR